jgi:hypothetical protein
LILPDNICEFRTNIVGDGLKHIKLPKNLSLIRCNNSIPPSVTSVDIADENVGTIKCEYLSKISCICNCDFSYGKLGTKIIHMYNNGPSLYLHSSLGKQYVISEIISAKSSLTNIYRFIDFNGVGGGDILRYDGLSNVRSLILPNYTGKFPLGIDKTPQTAVLPTGETIVIPAPMLPDVSDIFPLLKYAVVNKNAEILTNASEFLPEGCVINTIE